ncbi:lysophospholipid acyltransferase family protein [Chloroflexota bacterium]
MLLLWFYRLTTRVKVQGYDPKKLRPKKNKGLILIHNHPSLWEPAVLPFLFSPWYLFSPRFVPFSTPDKKNYFNKWWFFLYRAVCIPVERGNLKEEVRALRRMQKKLNEGGILIMAPEGGRTHKGEEFKVMRNGKTEIVKDLSEIDLRDGKAVRRFKSGIGRLIYNANADIIPLWTEGGEGVVPNKSHALYSFPRLWRKATIKIGEPLDLGGLSKKEIVEFLEDSILKTGIEG